MPLCTTRVVRAPVQMFEEQCRLNASLRHEVGSMQSQLLDIQRMLQVRGAGASSGADDGDTDENSQRAAAEQQAASRAPAAASEPDARVCDAMPLSSDFSRSLTRSDRLAYWMNGLLIDFCSRLQYSYSASYEKRCPLVSGRSVVTHIL